MPRIEIDNLTCLDASHIDLLEKMKRKVESYIEKQVDKALRKQSEHDFFCFLSLSIY